MHPLNYYTSELAIHDNIVEAARGGIPTLYESWKKQKGIRPFVLSWPSKDIVWNGKVTDRVVAFDAPRNKSRTRSFLLEVKEKTAAYALLYWEQQAQAVVGILESPHGSVSWHIPIQDHGNVRALGPPEEKVDVDYLELDWSALRDETGKTAAG